MVVNDADLPRLAFDPFEDDPPLIIDSDRVKLPQIPAQLLQPVGRGHGQVLHSARGVDSFEFALGASSEPLKFPDSLVVEERLSPLVSEGSNHRLTIPYTGTGFHHGSSGWLIYDVEVNPKELTCIGD